MPPLPLVAGSTTVDQDDWFSAVDFVNRLTWLAEAGGVDALVDAFMPDVTVFHPLGAADGWDESRELLTERYAVRIPGASQITLNHIVERDGVGVLVRYQKLIVPSSQTPALPGDQSLKAESSLTALSSLPVTDRLRRHNGRWKISERHLGEREYDARPSASRRG
ncbi:nuclear transport factor 2 family protein [Promicromonospora sukumoe]|uniref:nuclear transport factor 2 family protein n=1 Tax=Promicromonospora sukumoe TaxID=88382 RepID=UPI0037CC2F66